jgi:alkanesulfonate monooxygenase SsuD/methylene tetrahydromethanopterin reductase-like flavin-dependent oxidoreductase (luciferase family)
VYVAPARPLLEVVKQVATASVVSRGRVSLAVGVGWMREEFELMGQDFGNRGKRLDEMIPALRALWRGGWVSWSGRYYQVPELMIEPHPPVPVPILCGGDSDAALRRAARLCDGWVGYGYGWDDAVHHVEKLAALRAECGRAAEPFEKPFEIMLALYEAPSRDLVKRAEDIGITALMCSPWTTPDDITAAAQHSPGLDAERYRRPIERFAETVIANSRQPGGGHDAAQ